MDIFKNVSREINNISPKNKWKKLIGYYKPYKAIFFADMFFAFLGAAVSLIIPLIIRYITGNVVYEAGNTMLKHVFILVGIMLLLVLIECYSNYFISYYGHMMGAKIEFGMRNEIFGHFQKLSFSYYDNQKVGQLMSRITNDLFEITELLHHGPEDVVISVIKLVGSFVILLFVNAKLALAAFAVIPFMFVYAYILNKRMKRAFKRNRVRIAEINATIEDNLSGIRVVKSFANEEAEMEKFHEGNMNFLRSKNDSYTNMGKYHSGLNAFITLITVVVIAVAAVLMSKNALTATDLITFMLYINNFTQPVKQLINFTEQFQNGITGYERFLEILSIAPEINDKEDAITDIDIKGNVTFENVSFKYEGDLPYVFKNVNLDIKAGEYIALVGSSGVGKTTLLSLMPRFYEATEGAVKIEGVDIRDVKLSKLRQSIGVIQQDVYLFAGTIIDNIRYGKPDATEEQIIEASKKAGAHEFIMELPDGYNTNIGQRGVKLSGGQKQRISIARVFLKDSPILIFDEATSSLDNESERVVQNSLEKLAKNRTTFVIAHRLSTIKNAKRILVLTDEGIAEEGTHDELIKRDGIYKELYTLAYS